MSTKRRDLDDIIRELSDFYGEIDWHMTKEIFYSLACEIRELKRDEQSRLDQEAYDRNFSDPEDL